MSFRSTTEAALASIGADIKAIRNTPTAPVIISRQQLTGLANNYSIPNGASADGFVFQTVTIPAGAKLVCIKFTNHAFSLANQACGWLLRAYDYDLSEGAAGYRILDQSYEHNNGGGDGWDIGGRLIGWRPIKPTDGSVLYISMLANNAGGGYPTVTMMNNLSLTWFK